MAINFTSYDEKYGRMKSRDTLNSRLLVRYSALQLLRRRVRLRPHPRGVEGVEPPQLPALVGGGLGLRRGHEFVVLGKAKVADQGLEKYLHQISR